MKNGKLHEVISNMVEFLTEEQKEQYKGFCEFVNKRVKPYAERWEAQGKVSKDIIEKCAKEGYLGSTMPIEYNGLGWDTVTYGIFTKAVAQASTSLAGLFNVHTMVMQTILKWGTEKQKNEWLPRLSTGEILGAFALTEPAAGSDIRRIEAKFTIKDDEIVINGKKKWITFGGIADIILLFGYTDEEKPKPVACLVETKTPGLKVTRIQNMLGFKASYLAGLEFNHCVVKKENMITKPGFAFSHISPYALDYGRLSVAFTALGILRGCLGYSCSRAMSRTAFGSKLIDKSTIKEKITKIGTDYEAACYLCINACKAKDDHAPNSAEKIMLAKYFTTRAANEHAHSAVQIMGALGCNENHPVARYYRDSKVLEIIEGSNQIHEMILSDNFVKKYRFKEDSDDNKLQF